MFTLGRNNLKDSMDSKIYPYSIDNITNSFLGFEKLVDVKKFEKRLIKEFEKQGLDYDYKIVFYNRDESAWHYW